MWPVASKCQSAEEVGGHVSSAQCPLREGGAQGGAHGRTRVPATNRWHEYDRRKRGTPGGGVGWRSNALSRGLPVLVVGLDRAWRRAHYVDGAGLTAGISGWWRAGWFWRAAGTCCCCPPHAIFGPIPSSRDTQLYEDASLGYGVGSIRGRERLSVSYFCVLVGIAMHLRDRYAGENRAT